MLPHVEAKITDKKEKITKILGQVYEHMGLMGQDDDIYIAYVFVILPNHLAQSSCPDSPTIHQQKTDLYK